MANWEKKRAGNAGHSQRQPFQRPHVRIARMFMGGPMTGMGATAAKV
jgi:hypothetical protein